MLFLVLTNFRGVSASPATNLIIIGIYHTVYPLFWPVFIIVCVCICIFKSSVLTLCDSFDWSENMLLLVPKISLLSSLTCKQTTALIVALYMSVVLYTHSGHTEGTLHHLRLKKSWSTDKVFYTRRTKKKKLESRCMWSSVQRDEVWWRVSETSSGQTLCERDNC